MSLTRILIAEAKIEAVSVLVRRMVTDAIMRQPDPKRALRRLRTAAAGYLGEQCDQRRDDAIMASGKRALGAAEALVTLVGEIAHDVDLELNPPDEDDELERLAELGERRVRQRSPRRTHLHTGEVEGMYLRPA